MRLRIIQDNDPADPRDECNAGTMVCWHKRYRLGDANEWDNPEEFKAGISGYADRIEWLRGEVYDRLWEKWEDRFDNLTDLVTALDNAVEAKVAKLIERGLARHVILPLFLYDHSGITMSTGSFGCRFDSGQVGYIYCDPETIEREFEGDVNVASKFLESEVSVYDDYIRGDVYGFIAEDDEGNEVDSCWGFYGSDPKVNGMSDHTDIKGIEVVYE